jgi:hypothetical protein
MLMLIPVRAEARRLAREVRQSMLNEAGMWEIDADRQGRPIVSSGFRVALVPRRIRLFDAIHLFCNEVEVWLPLVARIKLRNAARLLIVRFAKEQWLNPSAEPCPTPIRTAEEQPI